MARRLKSNSFPQPRTFCPTRAIRWKQFRAHIAFGPMPHAIAGDFAKNYAVAGPNVEGTQRQCLRAPTKERISAVGKIELNEVNKPFVAPGAASLRFLRH